MKHYATFFLIASMSLGLVFLLFTRARESHNAPAEVIEVKAPVADAGPEAGPTVAKGRSKWDAPEIDGNVYVASRRPLRPGDIVTVKIERADAYDLHGIAV